MDLSMAVCMSALLEADRYWFIENGGLLRHKHLVPLDLHQGAYHAEGPRPSAVLHA
jgi:hypothetical protein